MENRVIVTGLGTGNYAEDGSCVVCNFDYSWLYNSPSVLLWSDKMIFTKHIIETIESGNKNIEETEIEILRKTVDLLKEYKILDIKNPINILTPQKIAYINKEIKHDIEIIFKKFNNVIKKDINFKNTGFFNINNHHYCIPHLRSIYSNLILSKEWNANCLFSDDVLNYCQYKFGLSKNIKNNTTPKAFNKIIRYYIPEPNIFPEYVLTNKNICNPCNNLSICKNNYLKSYEDNLNDYLIMREYDEIIQIKSLINEIIIKLKSEGYIYSDKCIIDEFKREEIKNKKMIKKIFPKIKRWSNLALLASIPISAIGVYTGLPEITAFGAVVAGATKMAEKYMDYKEQKYRWIGFKIEK